VQVLVEVAKRIGILGVADLAGRLNRYVGVFGERQQLGLEAKGTLAAAPRRHRHVIDNQFQAGMAPGYLADLRQEEGAASAPRTPARSAAGQSQPRVPSVIHSRLPW
jgi:hypothetical protein